MKRYAALLAAALCCAPAWALQPGDAIDSALLTRLQIDPDKVTVIDFFAEWCQSCRKELPLISAVHGRSNLQRVDFVGVDTDDSLQVAEAFQKELKAKGALSFRVVNDVQQELVKAFKPKGYPALYVVRGGKVVRAHLGAVPHVDKVLEQDLRALGVN
jgi:cytochrome c biogenesis protein CcmG, thiol:disulfide interchange protein DsbE